MKLALEPEVASLYCIGEIEKSLPNEKAGHHLVVDCGGGTVDIAAHKWTRGADDDLHVDELHKVHGGSCGSFAVNAEFEQLLLEILTTGGTDISLSDIRKECGLQWNKLLYENFEMSKCSFVDNQVNVGIPKPIHTYVEKNCGKTIPELIENFKAKWDTACNIVLPEKICKYLKKSGKTTSELIASYKGLQWDDDDDDDAIVVPPDIMTILFGPAIDQIIQIIEDVLSTDNKQANNTYFYGWRIL